MRFGIWIPIYAFLELKNGYRMIRFEWGFCEVRYMDFERILNVDKKFDLNRLLESFSVFLKSFKSPANVGNTSQVSHQQSSKQEGCSDSNCRFQIQARQRISRRSIEMIVVCFSFTYSKTSIICEKAVFVKFSRNFS